MSKTYRDAGVNIETAEKFVRKLSAFTGVASGIQRAQAFGCVYPRSGDLARYRQPLLVSSTDGVGTKLILAQKFGMHRGVGIDLVAMNVNDVVCAGARPLFFLDYIACGRLQPRVLSAVVRGIQEGMEQAQCSLLGGETAEMPGMYASGEYDLAGFCVGVVERKKLIDGRGVRAGDAVVGITSSGFHSNGFSLVRKVLPARLLRRYRRAILAPTRIYVQPVLSLLRTKAGNEAVHGIAHVTGGGFFHKVSKIVPSGLGIRINTRTWKVPQVFRMVQAQGVPEREMYTVFNMGIGMVLVVEKKYVRHALRKLQRFFPAKIVGAVERSKTPMRLEK
ncbi:MAG: phosphoribosylformylglycinamidine cyclo-ligase [Candidatus Omnitrophica bacterium]|nr:phosphoribosylformylglycinamidine cyclo-ligase [Candidatus Omnitrophota bacterium]